MKRKLLIVLFVVGFAIGIAQFFYVYDKTTRDNFGTIANPQEVACLAVSPECGGCLGEVIGSTCYSEPFIWTFRGFPLTSKAYGKDRITPINRGLYINIAIFAVGLPLAGYLGFIVNEKLVKKRR